MMDGEINEVIDAYNNSDIRRKGSPKQLERKKRRLMRRKRRAERQLMKIQETTGVEVPQEALAPSQDLTQQEGAQGAAGDAPRSKDGSAER